MSMYRAALAAVLLALAAAAPARAQDLLPQPEVEQAPDTIRRGAPLELEIRSAAPSVMIRVAGSPETDDYGRLTGPHVDFVTATGGDPTLHTWQPARDFVVRRRPGRYWWQAYIDGPEAADAEDAVGDVQRLVVRARKPTVTRLVPKWGVTNHQHFFVSSANFPAGVDPGRFATILTRSAARWGLSARNWTSAVAGKPDGFSVAGFGRVPKDALAVQVDFYRRGRVFDRDLVIRRDVHWDLGPAYPTFEEYDLETVLLHELSHFAGNKRHQPRCTNSPLVEALEPGEWWRGPQDTWFSGCARVAAHAAVVHRVVEL